MPVLRHLASSLCLVLAVTASAQIVNCSSNDMGRHSCPANTSNGVRLQRQISGSPCTAGQTWGYERGFIWVDRGCRADFALNVGTMPPGSAVDTMRSCKNAVSTQRPNVPLAYIQVDQPRVNGGSQAVNFRVQPPNGPRSAGYCDVFQNGRVNVVFNSGGGGNPPPGPGYGMISPQDAQRSCKNAASQRLPGVPLAYIATYRGSDTGDGNYMINFRSQPPGRPNASGFCIISKRGQMQRFQFDPGSGGNSGGGNSGGQASLDAMRSCKNAVSQRQPNVPLAYIQVDPARVNGGSLLVNFRVQPPGGPFASGSCDVFKNGRVNLQYNR